MQLTLTTFFLLAAFGISSGWATEQAGNDIQDIPFYTGEHSAEFYSSSRHPMQNKVRHDNYRIKNINLTYYDDPDDGIYDNQDAVAILKQADGQKVFIDTINVDLAINENEDIAKTCFDEKDSAKNPVFDGKIHGIMLPLPPAKEYAQEGCFNFILIETLDKRSFPVSSGGTGVVNILVRKEFTVYMARTGAYTIFHLR